MDELSDYAAALRDGDITRALEVAETGQQVTIWPRIDRAAGITYDTEAGAQPWTATLLGFATDDRLIVAERKGKYGDIYDAVRFVDASALLADRG